MASVLLLTFPVELILRILESANTSKDLSALIQTHPHFYYSWCSSPRLVCQAVLVNEGCLHPAQLLLRVQTGEPEDEEPIDIPLLLCNARRVCSIVDFAERAIGAKSPQMTAAERQHFTHTVYYIWICIEAAERGEDIERYVGRLDIHQLQVVSDTMMWIYAFSCPGFKRAVLSDFPHRWQPMLRKLHGLLKIRRPGQFVVPGAAPEDFFCSGYRAN